MRNAGTLLIVLVGVYFGASIFTGLLPGPVGDLPRMLWSSTLYTLNTLARIMGLPPEYVLILQHTIPQR